MSLTPQQAARHLLKLREAENNFLGFVKMLYPNWELPDFHLKMIDALDRLEKNKLTSHFGLDEAQRRKTEKVPVRNVLITMPPRHGKPTAL